jgi:hypothetical protein
MAELGLFQPEGRLVDLLLQHLSGIFVHHELAHPWRQKSLIGELLVLALGLHLVLLFVVSGLLGKGWVVKDRVTHELLLDEFHPPHDGRGISLLYDVDMVIGEIDLLFASLLAVLGLRGVWLLLLGPLLPY